MGLFVTVALVSATLSVPGHANTNASIASDDARVVVVWAASGAGGATDVYAAVSGDRGATFRPPVRVNDGDGDVKINGEQPPRVVVGAPGIVVSWISKRDGTTVRYARSIDGGRTFSRSVAVSAPGAPGNRGWHAMSIGADGRVHIIWLDHRDMAMNAGAAPADADHAAVHGKMDGAVMAERSRLMLATVELKGPSPERSITKGVCYCCKTTIANGPKGAIAMAWRHVYPGNIRDIAFTRSDDGRTFSAPARVSADQWQFDGCPEDGPAMAFDPRGASHIVWPTLVQGSGEPTLGLFYASAVAGRVFEERQPIPTDGLPHHPQVAVGGRGSVSVVWDELKGGTRQVALARGQVDARGHLTFTREVLGDSDRASYPVIAAVRDGLVVAWTSGAVADSVIRVTRLP